MSIWLANVQVSLLRLLSLTTSLQPGNHSLAVSDTPCTLLWNQ